MPVAIPEEVLRDTAQWMVDLRDYWRDELPMQLHTAAFDAGGNPAWHPDFQRWLNVDYYGKRSDQRWANNPEPRIRTTRAFRKLRKKAVREYEVCYRIIVLGEPIEETAKWLTERAIRNAKDDRYGVLEATLLLVSGVQKIKSWW